MACVAHYVPKTGARKTSKDTSSSMKAWRFLDQQTYHLFRKLLEFIFTVNIFNKIRSLYFILQIK